MEGQIKDDEEDKYFSTDVLLKKTLRNLFRKNTIKESYQVKYMKEKKDGTENKRLYYHWVDSSKREKVKKFFFDHLDMDEEW